MMWKLRNVIFFFHLKTWRILSTERNVHSKNEWNCSEPSMAWEGVLFSERASKLMICYCSCFLFFIFFFLRLVSCTLVELYRFSGPLHYNPARHLHNVSCCTEGRYLALTYLAGLSTPELNLANASVKLFMAALHYLNLVSYAVH